MNKLQHMVEMDKFSPTARQAQSKLIHVGPECNTLHEESTRTDFKSIHRLNTK